MAGEQTAAPGVAPPPAAPTPPAGANAPPAGQQQNAGGGNNVVPPEATWQEKAGFVKRVGPDKAERWVRPLKVDGQDIDFDPADPKSWEDLNLGVAAKRRMSEAAREKANARQELDNIVAGLTDNMQRDPIGTYEQMLRGAGIDPEKVWEFREKERARRAALSPEARAAEAYKQQAEQTRAQLEAQQRAQAQQESNLRTRALIEATDRGMNEAMAKVGLDPADPYQRVAVVMRAKAMLRKNPNGPQDLEAVASYVAQTHRVALPKSMDKVSDEQLLAYLGPERLARIHRLAAAAAAGPRPAGAPPPAVSRERRAPVQQNESNTKPMTPAQKMAKAQKERNNGRRFHGGI